MATTGVHRFGPFTIDGGAYRLSRDETILTVTPKVIDLLLYLVHRPSQLVSKDELFAALWPDVAVTDNALTQVVSELRQALGDDPSQPHYIQTVARRGYRFIAPVEAEAPRPAPGETAVATADALPSIGVLDFTNVTRDPSLDWLSSGIAETVTNDLRASLHARTIDRTRLVQASRRVGMDVEALRRELRLDLAVVGSFQRSADRLRITARALDAASGEALADSKADGLLTDVFDLQDRIVEQLSAALADRHGGARHRPIRDTSSLEAYQAFTEGRVRLETLDAPEIPRAIGDFERALACRSAVRGRARRAGHGALPAVRDVPSPQPARGGAARAGDRPRAPRDRARTRSRRGACHPLVSARERRTRRRSARGGAAGGGPGAGLLGPSLPPRARGLG